jgi:release factor glutamine methyltransferase
LLVCAAAGKSKEKFLRDIRMFAADGECERKTEDAIARRIAGEPLAYILGEWEFYGLPLRINRGVLIPRTDTEILADEGVKIAARSDKGARVMDLCAGSGCVGLAIAANAAACRVTLVESSAEALKLCKVNISKNSLTRSVVCIEADVRNRPPVMLGKYDLIVCNPPYIPTGDIEKLDASVRLYEPHVALDGGEDGLDFFRVVADRWTPLLRDGGRLAFECGAGQSDDVKAIMENCGLTDIRAVRDTLGHERVVVGANGTGAARLV